MVSVRMVPSAARVCVPSFDTEPSTVIVAPASGPKNPGCASNRSTPVGTSRAANEMVSAAALKVTPRNSCLAHATLIRCAAPS